jgi:hypothetical protein
MAIYRHSAMRVTSKSDPLLQVPLFILIAAVIGEPGFTIEKQRQVPGLGEVLRIRPRADKCSFHVLHKHTIFLKAPRHQSYIPE